jgi:hypothetical protein
VTLSDLCGDESFKTGYHRGHGGTQRKPDPEVSLTLLGRSSTIVSMDSLPLSFSRKVGIVLGTAVITSAASLLVALAALFGVVKGWFELGENGPWLPLIGLEYGFLLGIVLGVIIYKRKSRSDVKGPRLR